MLAVMICGSTFAQKNQQELNQLMKNRGEYYFSLPVTNPNEIQKLNSLCSVDKTDGQSAICYANQRQYETLVQQGYQPTLMTPPSMLVEAAMWDGTNRAEYDWDSYPTYSAYEEMMFDFEENHPNQCEILTLGTLPSGRKILIAHLHNGNTDGKPKFLYTSTIHGDETTGWIMMLRLIDYLLENPNLAEVQEIMNNIDLYIGPNTNPDGTYHGGNNNVNGATRYNANGVDMNRNYPDPHGSAHPDGEAYAQETQWFMQLAQDIPFVMAANYHGGAEVMNYPWDNSYTLTADDDWWQMVCHQYADLTHQMNPSYMNEYNNGITNGAQWYTIGGGRQDYMNAYAQCREVTIECSNTKLPSGSQLPTFWNYNKNSIFAYMNQCRYGIHGIVTDASNGQPLEATISITGHDDQYSTVSSHLPAGDYHRPIKGGTYTLTFTANGYYPHQETVTVTDGETVTLNVQLEVGEGILPDFTANPVDVALHSSTQFTDQTWGANLVSWSWTFEGGEPATSTQRNPVVTYNALGHFDVTLSVTNANGQTQTITKQNYINVSELYNMQNGTIETCDALFFDDGGPSGNYGDQRNYTMTFKPGTPGGIIEVTFSSFDLESNYDFLYIYDGSSTSAQQIGTYTSNDSPGTVTATNPEGALTFRFNSDYSVNKEGWAANVHCLGVSDPLDVTAYAEPAIINEGESTTLYVQATGGEGGYTYLWEPAEYLDDAHSASPIATPVLPSTEFTVIVTDEAGNTARDYVTVVIRNVNVTELGLEDITVFPNPTEGSFTVKGINGDTQYQLTNSLGQTVAKGNANHDFTLEKDLAKGLYFLKLFNDGQTSTLKITVK